MIAFSNNCLRKPRVIFAGLFALIVVSNVEAQPAPVPYRSVAVEAERPVHLIRQIRGIPQSSTISSTRMRTDGEQVGPYKIFEIIRCDGAPWLQIKFSSANLGERSTLKITSTKDGASQIFSGKMLNEWGYLSATFNGDSIELTLNVAPEEARISYKIAEIIKGKLVSRIGEDESLYGNTRAICGSTDNRSRSQHAWVGRIIPVGCTGWILSGNVFVTAGHCVTKYGKKGMGLLQFNIPESLDDGTPTMPHPRHQYAINTSRLRYENNGRGRDWAVFEVVANTETKELPEQAQEGAFRIKKELTPAKVAVVGFGMDDRPPGPSSPYHRNRDSQTQQADRGQYLSSLKGSLGVGHLADTQKGNSGAPIIALNDDTILSEIAIGIHTDGDCGPALSQGNVGTPIGNLMLLDAIKHLLETK